MTPIFSAKNWRPFLEEKRKEKEKELETDGSCLHPLSYGAYGRQDVPRYFQQTNGLQQNLLS
mgnify:FL=1